MSTRSRQIKEVISEDKSLPEGYGYCRVCQRVKNPQKFFSATDKTLDSNNLMSICKDCCDSLYKNILF